MYNSCELVCCNAGDEFRKSKAFIVNQVVHNLVDGTTEHGNGNLPSLTYLRGILKCIIKILLTNTRSLLESFQVGEFSVGAEGKDQKIKEVLGLRCPLALDNTPSCPRSSPNVMGIKLLLRPTQYDQMGLPPQHETYVNWLKASATSTLHIGGDLSARYLSVMREAIVLRRTKFCRGSTDSDEVAMREDRDRRPRQRTPQIIDRLPTCQKLETRC